MRTVVALLQAAEVGVGSIVFPSLHAALAEAFPAAVLLFLQPLFQSVHRLPALRRSTLRELLHAGEGGAGRAA